MLWKPRDEEDNKVRQWSASLLHHPSLWSARKGTFWLVRKVPRSTDREGKPSRIEFKVYYRRNFAVKCAGYYEEDKSLGKKHFNHFLVRPFQLKAICLLVLVL